MIKFQRGSNERIVELGGGNNPQVFPECQGGKDVNIDVQQFQDAQGKQTVDIVWDLGNFPWPIKSDEFDAAISVFSLEHVSWRKTKEWLSEAFRIIKPGAQLVVVVPNTEKQMEYIREHQEGWENRDLFTSASITLFGDQNYSGNFHAAYFSPKTIHSLFSSVGFEDILSKPYGTIGTDLIVQAKKPISASTPQQNQPTTTQVRPENLTSIQVYDGPNKSDLTSEQRGKLFNQQYFDNYQARGLYLDYPHHEIVARRILERKPDSVLELGCARGYTLKKLQDRGVACLGVDISKHVCMTRVCDCVYEGDVLDKNSEKVTNEYDLLYTCAFWEHIPEDLISVVLNKVQGAVKRGLHAITFAGQDSFPDNTRCTLRSKEWWVDRLPKNHEIISVQELQQGALPEDYVRGDGKTKLNVGCAWTMFHNGWINCDIIDAIAFAQQSRFNFQRVDARQGLPFGTEVVDSIFTSHMLEHLIYNEGISLLREFRRVIRPTGGLRILVPDSKYLMDAYSANNLDKFDEINGNCAESPTNIGKLWALLHDNHQSAYDAETLVHLLKDAGWEAKKSDFRHAEFGPIQQILHETVEMEYGGMSLFVDAIPSVVA